MSQSICVSYVLYPYMYALGLLLLNRLLFDSSLRSGWAICKELASHEAYPQKWCGVGIQNNNKELI